MAFISFLDESEQDLPQTSATSFFLLQEKQPQQNKKQITTKATLNTTATQAIVATEAIELAGVSSGWENRGPPSLTVDWIPPPAG